ncbi:hypothetical protein HID58_043025, partial [Brassica napus]
MLERGKSAPDKHTFPFVLKACAYILTETDSLLGGDGYVNNGLIHLYGMFRFSTETVPTDACNPRGIVNKGRQYFETIMPMKPDAVIWRSLLDACCKNGASVELSEEIATRLVERREGNQSFSGAYVLLSMHWLASGTMLFFVTRSFCRHSIVLSSLDRSVITRPFCHHSTVMSSFDRSVVTRPFCRRSRGGSARIALSWLLVIDSSLVVTRRRSFSRSPLERSLAVTRLALYGYSSWIALSQSLGEDRSLAVPWIDLSRSLDSLSCGHSTRSLRHSAQIVLSQSLGSISHGHSTHSLAVTRRRSFSRSRSVRSLAVTQIALLQLLVTQLALLRSLDSLSCGHSTRSLAVTRLALCGYSSWIALSQLLGADRSLAVAWIDLPRSLDSLSRSHSAQIVLSQSLGSLSLAVTRLALLQSLGADRSLAFARIDLSRSLKSLSCSYSSRIVLLLLLVMDRSL